VGGPAPLRSARKLGIGFAKNYFAYQARRREPQNPPRTVDVVTEAVFDALGCDGHEELNDGVRGGLRDPEAWLHDATSSVVSTDEIHRQIDSGELLKPGDSSIDHEGWRRPRFQVTAIKTDEGVVAGRNESVRVAYRRVVSARSPLAKPLGWSRIVGGLQLAMPSAALQPGVDALFDPRPEKIKDLSPRRQGAKKTRGL
jgi:hypothetical protein